MSHEFPRLPLLALVTGALRRRRRIAALALTVPLAGTLACALFLPRSYRSTAQVVVERGGADDDDVDARLSQLTSENTSYTRLSGLIARLEPYREARRKSSQEQLVEQMRKNLTLEYDKEDRAGRTVVTAIRIAYTASSPQLAADVANEIASFYEREDLRIREDRARQSVAALETQLSEAKGRLEEQERRLKDYKMRNLSELPEQVALHLSELAQISTQMRSTRADAGSAPRARAAQAPQPAAVYDARLDRLAELRSRYTDEHPEVKALKREIEMHPVRQNGAAGASTASGDADAAFAGGTAEQIERARQRNAELAQRAAELERGILQAPFHQQEINALLPDYVAARSQYQSLWEKYETARLRDPHRDDGRIAVLDTALPPRRAVAPSMLRIIAIGLAVAIATAVAAVALAERMDTSFHSVADLRVFTRVPVLATVPRSASWSERNRRSRDARVFTAKLLVALVFAFVGSAYLSRGSTVLVTWFHHFRL